MKSLRRGTAAHVSPSDPAFPILLASPSSTAIKTRN
jgi:hypothetical protein